MSWKELLLNKRSMQYLTSDEIQILKSTLYAKPFVEPDYGSLHRDVNGKAIVIDAEDPDDLYNIQISIYDNGTIVVDNEYTCGGHAGSDYYYATDKESFDQNLSQIIEQYFK